MIQLDRGLRCKYELIDIQYRGTCPSSPNYIADATPVNSFKICRAGASGTVLWKYFFIRRVSDRRSPRYGEFPNTRHMSVKVLGSEGGDLELGDVRKCLHQRATLQKHMS